MILVKKKKLPVYRNVEILDIGAEGKAIARIDDKVVFIPGGIPGDIIDLQIKKKRKKYMEGYPIAFHHYSIKRVPPRCEHFGTCGGCKWQHLNYEDQIFYKKKQVVDTLERIGKINKPDVCDVKTAAETFYYRNKLEFTFTNQRWLKKEEMGDGEKNMDGVGFHVAGLFAKVVDINHCYLQPSPSNEIRLAVKAYAKENNLPFFDIRKQEGLLRNMIIKTARTNELMVIISFFYEDHEAIEHLLQYLAGKFPEISSLMYVVNPKANDTIDDLPVKLYKGKDHITEKLDGLLFKIGPKSFFQTNPRQAEKLYGLIKECLSLSGEEIIYDLYSGIGSIAIFLAKHAKKIVGIEYLTEAVEDAKKNTALNNITNTAFIAGDMKDVLCPELTKKHGHPDIIIADPPRAGMHNNVIDAILNIKPDRFVYVSCNVATQARDINMMKELYETATIQPVDMFPHTHHIENILVMNRKDKQV